MNFRTFIPARSARLGTLIVMCGLLTVFAGCEDELVGTPRPRAYPRINYPTGNTQLVDAASCPFAFEYPSYAELRRDTSYFGELPPHPCWFDLATDALNGQLHLSYAPIRNQNDFERLRDDAFELASKHNVVASYIDELPISRPDAKVYGFVFSLEGNVASPFQFYLTDSTRHFVRGALYVNARASADSLAPVYDFLRSDALGMIDTWTWEDQ